MKQQLDRDWLERYKTNHRGNNTVYKNYANPTNAYGASRAQEAIEQGILKGYPVGEQETLKQMISTLPPEMRSLSPEELITHIRNTYEFNKGFGEQLEGMRSQNENRFNQMQTTHTQKMEQLRQQAVQQRAAQLAVPQRAQQSPQQRAIVLPKATPMQTTQSKIAELQQRIRDVEANLALRAKNPTTSNYQSALTAWLPQKTALEQQIAALQRSGK